MKIISPLVKSSWLNNANLITWSGAPINSRSHLPTWPWLGLFTCQNYLGLTGHIILNKLKYLIHNLIVASLIPHVNICFLSYNSHWSLLWINTHLTIKKNESYYYYFYYYFFISCTSCLGKYHSKVSSSYILGMKVRC